MTEFDTSKESQGSTEYRPTEETKADCLLQGAFGVIDKPCKFDAIKKAIHKAFENRLAQLGTVSANA